MISSGLNDLIHWPLDIAENMNLKEDFIIQTLVSSCPSAYLIQFSVEAGNFLITAFPEWQNFRGTDCFSEMDIHFLE